MHHLSNSFKRFFTPAHRRPVDEHLLRDEASKRLIAETENLLNNMIDKADGLNKKRTFKRKQENWTIKIRIDQKTIKLFMSDLKHSQSPIKKRVVIVCFRKYVKSKDGVGLCKEATIHFLKDGRAHVRSIKESPSFRGVFFRIHRLDEAYIYGFSHSLNPPSTPTIYKTAYTDVALLNEEVRRYIDTIQTFSLDPLIESRLIRLLEHSKKIQADFELLNYEEKHTIRRMLREDIPYLLNTFLSLSLKHQLEQKEDVFVALSKMELTLIDYLEQLEQARLERMNHLLRLQAIRYERNQT